MRGPCRALPGTPGSTPPTSPSLSLQAIVQSTLLCHSSICCTPAPPASDPVLQTTRPPGSSSQVRCWAPDAPATLAPAALPSTPGCACALPEKGRWGYGGECRSVCCAVAPQTRSAAHAPTPHPCHMRVLLSRGAARRPAHAHLSAAQGGCMLAWACAPSPGAGAAAHAGARAQAPAAVGAPRGRAR